MTRVKTISQAATNRRVRSALLKFHNDLSKLNILSSQMDIEIDRVPSFEYEYMTTYKQGLSHITIRMTVEPKNKS